MADFFPVVVHHNAGCGTSRNVVAMIEAAGYAPTIVEYLQTGWTLPQLQALLAAMGAHPRELLREKGTPYADLGLGGRIRLQRLAGVDMALLDIVMRELSHAPARSFSRRLAVG